MIYLDIKELLFEMSEEILVADGFDEALIGFSERAGGVTVAAYDTDKCIQILMDRDGMNYEEAIDYMYFNVVSSYVGSYTPVFITDLTEEV